MNRKTVFKWLVKLEHSGDCHDRKQPGSKSKLTKEQNEKPKKMIYSGPRSYGYDTDLWTLKSISEVISREFDVIYNTTHVWRVLKNLDYSAQFPVAVVMEKKPEYVKEAEEKNATILFQDELGVQRRPNVRKTWSKRGKRPGMKVRENREKI